MFDSKYNKLVIAIISSLSLVLAITINQFCNMPCCKEIIETSCCDSSSPTKPSNIHSMMNIASNANHCNTFDNQFINSESGCNHVKNKVLDKKIFSKDLADIVLTQNFTKEYYPALSDEDQPYSHNINLFCSFLLRSNIPLIC